MEHNIIVIILEQDKPNTFTSTQINTSTQTNTSILKHKHTSTCQHKQTHYTRSRKDKQNQNQTSIPSRDVNYEVPLVFSDHVRHHSLPKSQTLNLKLEEKKTFRTRGGGRTTQGGCPGVVPNCPLWLRYGTVAALGFKTQTGPSIEKKREVVVETKICYCSHDQQQKVLLVSKA